MEEEKGVLLFHEERIASRLGNRKRKKNGGENYRVLHRGGKLTAFGRKARARSPFGDQGKKEGYREGEKAVLERGGEADRLRAGTLPTGAASLEKTQGGEIVGRKRKNPSASGQKGQSHSPPEKHTRKEEARPKRRLSSPSPLASKRACSIGRIDVKGDRIGERGIGYVARTKGKGKRGHVSRSEASIRAKITKGKKKGTEAVV